MDLKGDFNTILIALFAENSSCAAWSQSLITDSTVASYHGGKTVPKILIETYLKLLKHNKLEIGSVLLLLVPTARAQHNMEAVCLARKVDLRSF